ncbi:MAG TPA: glycosyltransferase, partial [Vicinamibacterales bacterium]|nr:glycosyltransferase [Vicinamibacterales bacterium]
MTSVRPAVSVIMINRNGGEYLAPALATCRRAIEHAQAVEPDIELIVVDNGSTDQPLPVIERELAAAPFLWRVVPESQAGVNFARNAGLVAANGELVFFVDSDLEFDEGWLRAFVEAARDYPSAHVFAGRVKVGKLESPPPPWLPVDGPLVRTSIVVRCDYGDAIVERAIDDGAGPVGPNMGFRRDLFRQFGPFDTRFGLRPGSLVPGAESEFFDRLARDGVSFLYVPGALVHHPVRSSQMTREYFSKRLRGIGRATSRLRRLRGQQPRQVFGLTLYMVRQLAAATSRWAWLCARGATPAECAHARGDVDVAIGFLQEDLA